MSDPTPPITLSASSGFSVDDGIKVAQGLGALAVAINPAVAGAVAAITGIADLLRNTVIPAIQHAHDTQLTVAQQAQLAADSAAERARVGAPQAVIN